MAAYSDKQFSSFAQKQMLVMFQNTQITTNEDLIFVAESIADLINGGGSVYEAENIFYKIASNPRWNCNIDWCNVIINYIIDGKAFGKDSIMDFDENERGVFSLTKSFMRNNKKKLFYPEYVIYNFEYLIEMVYYTKSLIDDFIAVSNGKLQELIEADIEHVILNSISNIINQIIRMQDRYERDQTPIAANAFWQNSCVLTEKIIYKHLEPIYNEILTITCDRNIPFMSSFDDFYGTYGILVSSYLGMNWESIKNSEISFQTVENMLLLNIKYIHNGLISLEKEINKMFNSIIVFNWMKLGNIKKNKVRILP